MNWENMEPDNKEVKKLKKEIKDLEENTSSWDNATIGVLAFLMVLAFMLKQYGCDTFF